MKRPFDVYAALGVKLTNKRMIHTITKEEIYMKKKAHASKILATVLCAAVFSGTAGAQSVTLGYSGPLSGGGALYGKNALSGIEMAVEEFNAKGGYPICGKQYRFEVVALDDKYSPSETAINAKRLVQQHKTPIVFTPHSGGTFSMQVFNEQEKFIIASYTSIPEVSERGNRLTVRIPPNFKTYIEPFSKYTMNRFGPKVGIAGANHTYAKMWTEAFIEGWKKLGGTVVAENSMDYNRDTDFYSGVSRVLAAKPDVLFIGGPSEPTALVAKQARELGFKGGFIVMDQAKLDEMARIAGGFEPLEGSVGVMPLIANEDEAAQAFIRAYQERYGRPPTTEASLNHYATYAFAEAMNQACSVDDPHKIRAALPKAIAALPPSVNTDRVSGIDENGAFTLELRFAAVEGGRLVVKHKEDLVR